jgi:hypothetical protein
MKPHPQKSQSDYSLKLFARNLKENGSRYEAEALVLLRDGLFEKHVEGVTVVHFLRDGGSGYQISNDSSKELQEVFFQSLDEDPGYRLKLIVDQMAQGEVDASLLIDS